MTNQWPTQATLILIRGYATKKTFNEIKHDLMAAGFYYSRNAVIGKAHRLDLKKRDIVPTKINIADFVCQAIPVEKGNGISFPDAVDRKGCLYGLSHGFCGKKRTQDSVMCKRHNDLCYRPMLSLKEYEKYA